MKKLWVLLVLVACVESPPTALPTTSFPNQDTIAVPLVPSVLFRHPAFHRDTTWNENNPGMTLVYESQAYAKFWSYQIVTDTLEAVRKGWRAQRFEVRPGDCFGTDCMRTPVYERNEFAQAYNENLEGDEYWYGWSFYVPNNVEPAPWVFLGQFQQHYNYDSIWMFMKRAGEPFCAVLDWRTNNHWNCTGSNGTYPLIPDTEFRGRWHDVVVHAKWTEQHNGFTRIYINGVLMVDYSGYTRTSGNSDVYFKYGIYRHGSTKTSVVYFDEIRRGKKRNQVDILLLEK